MTPRVVLVVEDNPIVRKLVRLTLGNEGLTILEAGDGTTAIRLVADTPPDLILQDLLLPDIDGFELVGRLRAMPALQDVPIIAFSGFLSRLEHGRAAASGFTDFLPKPVEPSRLVQVVRAHLPSDAQAEPVSAHQRVLVVDDDPVQLKLARLRFTGLGLDVKTATDGVEALEVLQHGGIDAVVSDVLMPRLDGFSLCAAIRRDPRWADVPVILVSSNYVDEGDRDLARHMGATTLLVRTPDLAGVIQALRAGPAPPPPGGVQADPSEHHERVLRQLERQAALNAAFAHRSAMNASMLSVVAGMSEALTHGHSIEESAPDVLASLLEASGVSMGALFVVRSHTVTPGAADDALVLEAHAGWPADASRDIDAFWGHREILLEAAAAGRPLVLSAEAGDPAGHGVLARAAAQSALLIPCVADEQCLAVFVLASQERDLTDGDWMPFARTVSVQLGQSFALSRAFDALRTSEARFARLAESGVIGITVSDTFGNVVDANDAYLRMVGYTREELAHGDVRWVTLTPPEYTTLTDRIAAQLTQEGVVPPAELETLRKDGTRVPVLFGVAALDAVTVIAFVVDLTEQKRAEAALAGAESQLRQAQKMEAVGRLAGGVAHDFNNLLSVILGLGDIVLSELKPGDPLRTDVEEICAAGRRAADLTRQLLIFSRQHVVEPKVLDLNDVLRGMDRMLGRLLGEDIDLTTRPSADLGRVKLDPGSLEQVIMNLVVNARDAMPTGGRLTIETANVELTEAGATRHLHARPGPYVALSVSDTGTGMSQETQARMFDPFFTTKEQGKGTGLGLSTVYGIVQQCGGGIEVDSEVGRGSSFRVLLPRVNADLDAVVPRTAAATYHGTETILLVEDEEQVRAVASSILRRQGYRVLAAQNGEEALRLCDGHEGVIDLLLTDVVMPQMSGPELAARLVALRPAIRVLCMSGYTDDSIVRHGVLAGSIAFLQKPITPQSLGKRVREVLDATT